MRRLRLHGTGVALLAAMAAASCLGIGMDARAQVSPGNGTKPGPAVTWPGMTAAGTVLLPNGWSLKPAGRQTRLGDLPVQIAVHPSEPVLAILHAGFGEHEIVIVDLNNHKQ